MGLLASKDAGGFLAAMSQLHAHFHMVPITGHEHHAPATLAETARLAGFTAGTADYVGSALAAIAQEDASGTPPVVLIAGSLYLAGKALEANGTIVD